MECSGEKVSKDPVHDSRFEFARGAGGASWRGLFTGLIFRGGKSTVQIPLEDLTCAVYKSRDAWMRCRIAEMVLGVGVECDTRAALLKYIRGFNLL